MTIERLYTGLQIKDQSMPCVQPFAQFLKTISFVAYIFYFYHTKNTAF
jgi:hypothetical protein